jgi:pimeloyl-ACP methyl ester carboxylesterase
MREWREQIEHLSSRQADASQVVVLLPGLWMPAWVMLPLAWRLRARGHRCVRFGYASAWSGLEANSERLARLLGSLRAERVHIVGHSLGGVLALHTVASRHPPRVHRIVMAGSPYADTYAARRLAEREWGRRMLGHTVPQWLAREKPSAPAGVEIGVIAGTLPRGLAALVAPEMPRPHDGVIRVVETPVPGMAAYAEVHTSHALMLISAEVARLVERFLSTGRFGPASAGAAVADDVAAVVDRERS